MSSRGAEQDDRGADRDAMRRRNQDPLARALALDRDQVDANHRSATRLNPRPTATAAVARDVIDVVDLKPLGVEGHALERIEQLDRRVEALGEDLEESFGARGAAADDDAIDAIRRRRRLEEVERLLNLEHHVFADRAQHRPRVLEGDAVDRLAALQLVGLLVRQVQLLLQRLGVGVAADRDVAGEDRLIALEDVDVGGARPGIEQHHDLPRLDAVVHFEGVLQREGVDVDDHRAAPGLRDHAGVVGDLFLLRGDQQDVHGGLPRQRVAGVQDLVVEVHVLDVEGDVLLGLPVDGFGELRLGHHRQRDLLDDHGVARQGRGDVARLDLAALEQPPDRIRHRRAVDDRAVDDAVRGNGLGAEGGDLVALAGRPSARRP